MARWRRFDQDPLVNEWLQTAERGDTVAVVHLLERGRDVNTASEINTTALMLAVEGGHTQLVQLLLDRGANLNPENTLGFTAMTYAVIRSRSWGGYWRRVSQPDSRPLKLLLAAGGQYRLLEAVLLNDVGLVSVRLDEGADVDTGAWSYHGPVLKIAAELGYLEIVKLLLDRGADVEATDDAGQRPLLSAARYGQSEVICLLLNRGAKINATGWSGQSALSNAVVGGHDGLFQLLLARGAERGVVDAIALNDVTLLEALLDEKLHGGSDVDHLSDGCARLAMFAASRGNVAIVQLLLDRGAGLIKEGYDRHSLLAEAARYGHTDVVKLLIDRGANVHAVGRDGLTPLAWAMCEHRNEVVRLLRAAGAAW
jgi:ankyrin repeat protein